MVVGLDYKVFWTSLSSGNIEPVKPATGKTALLNSKPSEKPIYKDAKQKRDKATSDEDGDDSDGGEDSDDNDESKLQEDSDTLEQLVRPSFLKHQIILLFS